jgi:hypothetical protein
MKRNYNQPVRKNVAVITVSLILLCQSLNSQPGYYPMYRMPTYHTVVVPNAPPQSYQKVYTPNVQTVIAHPVISLGIHFDPLISWFSTNGYNSHSDGSIAGFNFGMSYNKYFNPYYSFSSGINIINAGGRLVSNDITSFDMNNYSIVTVQPGEAIIYRITYLSIPLGVKLRTSRIGYGRFFTDLGFDPKIVIAARADIPSLNISGGNALPQLNTFNLSFHIMAGMEYPLVGHNTFSFGIGFDNDLFDVTRYNGGQSSDVVHQKSLSFRLGITF